MINLMIGVAPRAGAWIETLQLKPLLLTGRSRPVRARGLKLDGLVAHRDEPRRRAPCGRVD